MNNASRATLNSKYIVAICTFKRPQLLENLLKNLLPQVVAAEEIVSVLVLDNDPAVSAKQVIIEAEKSLPTGLLFYKTVSPKGLAVARNAAIEHSLKSSANLIFIDDDEKPEHNWLTNMIAAHREFRESIIAGPVLPVLPSILPAWSPRGEFWKRNRFQHFSQVPPTIGDGNVLFPLSFLTSGIRYDIKFNLTGGQDTKLFRESLRSGFEIRWADNAVVWEYIPEERLTVEYAKERTFLASCAFARIEKAESKNSFFALLRIFRYLIRGSMYCLLGTISQNQSIFAKGLISLSIVHGTYKGLLGKTYDRYINFQSDFSK